MEMKKKLRKLCWDAAISCGIPSVDMPLIAEYLARNGVIAPPCNVNDAVYAIRKNKVIRTNVYSMCIQSENGHWLFIIDCNIFDGISMHCKFQYGKTVFLNKEDAEKMLEEMRAKK